MNKANIFTLLYITIVTFSYAQTITEFDLKKSKSYRITNDTLAELPLSYESPHVKWSKNYVFGKLNLMMIVSNEGARELVELKQRIPSNIIASRVYQYDKLWTGKGYVYKLTKKKVSDNIVDNLNKANYDVIVIGKIKWSLLTDEIKKLIFNKVKSGSSLLLISPWGDEFIDKKIQFMSDENIYNDIKSSVPLSYLPITNKVEYPHHGKKEIREIGPIEIKSGIYGEGKVVILDYNDIFVGNKNSLQHVIAQPYWRQQGFYDISITPYLRDDPLYYEYYFSILGKVLYNISSKKSSISVSFKNESVQSKYDNDKNTSIDFIVKRDELDHRDFDVYYEIRNKDGVVVFNNSDSINLINIRSVYKVMPPRLMKGRYFIDFWIKDGDNVLDWASSVYEVLSEKNIKSLKLSKDFYFENESIFGEVSFSNIVDWSKIKVNINLVDSHNRVIRKLIYDREFSEFKFEKFKNVKSNYYKIILNLIEQDNIIDSASVDFSIPNSEIDDFQFLMWADGRNTRKNKVILQRCKDYGVTGYYDVAATWTPEDVFSYSAKFLAKNNMIAYPYCNGVWDFALQEPYLAFENKYLNSYPKKINTYKKYGVMAYSICEESYISTDMNKWDNSHALNDFRVYLQNKYYDIPRLNDIWRTNYKSFSEIKFITFENAKESRMYTHWLDQKLHKIDRFNKVHESVNDLIQELSPGAKIGFDCIHGMDYDWPRMSKIVDSFTQAPLDDLKKGGGVFRGNWTGHYLNELEEYIIRKKPWEEVFKGGTHMMWWAVAGAFTADISMPYACMLQTTEEIIELQSGIAKLLMNSTKRVDPIRILWSNESYHASIINPKEQTWEASKKSFKNVFRRLGLDFLSVDPSYINNELDYNNKNRVLVLPMSQSMSIDTVDSIKNFVKKGGLVITDSMPAVVNEYLQPFEKTKVGNTKIKFEKCNACQGKKRLELKNVWQSCPSCGGIGKKEVSSKLIKEKSMLSDVFNFKNDKIKKYGKGYGFFINNIQSTSYKWDGLKKILTEIGGIKNDIEIVDKIGNLRKDIKSYVFEDGNSLYLGMIPDRNIKSEPGDNVRVVLKDKKHIYNIRRNKYYGYLNEFTVSVFESSPKLFALLSEKVRLFKLLSDKKIYEPCEIVKINGTLSKENDINKNVVLNISVMKDEEVIKELSENILTKTNSIYYEIPLALNQVKGEYTVVIKEVVSGLNRNVSFKVQ